MPSNDFHSIIIINLYDHYYDSTVEVRFQTCSGIPFVSYYQMSLMSSITRKENI